MKCTDRHDDSGIKSPWPHTLTCRHCSYILIEIHHFITDMISELGLTIAFE